MVFLISQSKFIEGTLGWSGGFISLMYQSHFVLDRNKNLPFFQDFPVWNPEAGNYVPGHAQVAGCDLSLYIIMALYIFTHIYHHLFD